MSACANDWHKLTCSTARRAVAYSAGQVCGHVAWWRGSSVIHDEAGTSRTRVSDAIVLAFDRQHLENFPPIWLDLLCDCQHVVIHVHPGHHRVELDLEAQLLCSCCNVHARLQVRALACMLQQALKGIQACVAWC